MMGKGAPRRQMQARWYALKQRFLQELQIESFHGMAKAGIMGSQCILIEFVQANIVYHM